jgi:hypothetical protein
MFVLQIRKGDDIKKIILILVLFFSASGLFAKKENNNIPFTKKEKQEYEFEKLYQSYKSMLEKRDFVLEAYYLQDRFGRRCLVNSQINFVAVDSTVAIIQVGSNFRIGPNGVGGKTVKGRITNFKLTEDTKQKTIFLYINVMTPIGFYNLNFSISPNIDSTAKITGLSYGQLTFEGDLEPYSQSSVFEGESL